MHKKPTPTIRDPIHGFVTLSNAELSLLDQPALQRLRNVKQLGLVDLAFPGATHTRYNHSLGAMHVATRLFDSLFGKGDLPAAVHNHFRQAVRVAMLLHDIGHPPLSHAAEAAMPAVKELKLPKDFPCCNPDGRATHEDYTLKIILDSSLTAAIEHLFGDQGISPRGIAALICARPEETNVFTHDGLDYTPILKQIVSSECDADRMDYLRRDSVFCGVDYGKFDADWLIHNVVPVQQDGSVYLGLLSRALFAFEDFLLSRYHMFATVYLHHTPVLFNELLRRCFFSLGESFTLPGDIEAYLSLDDITIWHTLRTSLNPWARLIVQRRPYHMLTEHRYEGGEQGSQSQPSTALQDLHTRLVRQSLEPVTIHSESTLAKSPKACRDIYILPPTGKAVPLDQYVPLYRRYKHPARFHRVYVPAVQKQQAAKVLHTWINHKHPRKQHQNNRVEGVL